MFKIRLILAILYTLAIFLALPITGCAPAEYEIEAEANPEEAGEITGTGTYEENEEVALKAEPEEGYKFDYWELEGEEVSTEQEYTFNAEEDHLVTAHFSEIKYEVKVEIDPEATGKVSGDGTFKEGEEITVEASPKEGYEFSSWKENGDKVSSSGEYTFTVKSDKNLVAVFDEINFEVKEGKDGEAFEKKVELHINIEQGSPRGNYILSLHAVGLNSYAYAIYDMGKWDHEEEEFLDNAKERLPTMTPGDSMTPGGTYAPQISPDGHKLAYSTEGIGENREVSKGAIYVINFGMPADIKHEIPFEKDELVAGIPPAVTPGWEPNSEAIYYITADGLMHYSFEDQEQTKIAPAFELSGLIQKNEEIPTINMHAFNIVNDPLQLAYVDFDENLIKVLSIEDEIEEKVIDVETKIKEIWYNELEFLFNGKYLALRQGLIIETETGEKVDFGNEGDILSYAWNREDRLVVLTGEEYGEGYELKFKLLDSDLEEIETLSTLAPETKITRKGVEVTSHNDKWLFGIDGKVYSFDFK